VAAVAGVLGVPRPVAAHDSDDVWLGHGNDTATTTQITNTGGDTCFWAKATGGGNALFANTDSGLAISAVSDSGDAIDATSTSGTAVLGISTTGVGTSGGSDSNHGVHGSSNSHVGVWGQTAANQKPAVFGWGYQGAAGLVGVSGLALPPNAPNAPKKTGVYGYAAQDATSVGIRGTAPLGRGAVLTGAAAPLRLVPSNNTGHPAHGQTGDLYVDASGRLWFCKGATWKQIA